MFSSEKGSGTLAGTGGVVCGPQLSRVRSGYTVCSGTSLVRTP